MILEQGVFETVSPLIRSNVEEAVCRRIVYYIKQVFGVEFAWNVVVFLKTIRQLAVRVGYYLLFLTFYLLTQIN